MWNVISLLLLVVEILLLASFIIGKLRKKKVNETIVFLTLVFVVNLALYFVPYIHSVTVLGKEKNHVFAIMDCITNAVKLFLGSVNTGAVSEFTMDVPSFTITYLVGALLALLATVSAAVEAFGRTVLNSFRLTKAMKKPSLDVVLGEIALAQRYAKGNDDAVILLEDGKKETAVALMDAGCIILRKKFSPELLKSRYFKPGTHYNMICVGENEDFLPRLDAFIAFKKGDDQGKDISLYIEVGEDKAETVRREIIDKSGFSANITTFCSRELLARTFTQAHPITEYMPTDFIVDAAIEPDRKVQMFFLGFGNLSRELYRQSVLNNQLVSFQDGEYRVHPVHYRIYDPAAEEAAWNIGGLQRAMEALQTQQAEYFPLPEMPYRTDVVKKSAALRDTLRDVTDAIRQNNSHSCVIVDVGDDFCNIQTGARLRSMLVGAENYHIFVRSTAAYTQNDEFTTYYGDFDKIFTHDVIVDDSLSTMARKVNEIYTGNAEKAAAQWAQLNYFTLYSNLYSAMNLRLKLHLLGLDYQKGEGGGNLIAQRLQHRGEYAYEEYFVQSRRNALLAQEHARWNAYHLLGEFMPMEKSAVVPTEVTKGRVRFHTKDMLAGKHACLTTFCGLNDLSSHLAQAAGEATGKAYKPEEYDYYIYDEMLITSAEALAGKLGYHIIER